MSFLDKIESLLSEFEIEWRPLVLPAEGKVDTGSEGISYWLNNLGGGGQGNKSSRDGRLTKPISKGHSPASAAETVGVNQIKERLLKFVNGEADDDHSLVNMRRLTDAGIDHSALETVFGDCQKRGAVSSAEKRVQLLGMALYMNTLGLPEAARLGLCLALFHEKRVEAGQEKGEDGEKFTRGKKSLAFLSKDEVMRTCQRHFREHTASKAMGKMIAAKADTVMDLVDAAIACRMFDSEVFLTEYTYGFHLPKMARAAFDAFIEHHEKKVYGHVIDVEEDYCNPDVTMTLAKNVASLEDVTLLKKDVFRYTLPQRYHIKDGCTETMMDVVLDSVAVGVDLKSKGQLYDAVHFTGLSRNEENTMLHLKTMADQQFEDERQNFVGFVIKACAVAVYLSILRMARPTEWPFKAASAKDTAFTWGDLDGSEDYDDYMAARDRKKNLLFWETGVFYMISKRHIFRSRSAWPLLSRYVCEMNKF